MVCVAAGTPVKPSKTVLCDTELIGLGVGFDVEGEKLVFVPQRKRNKYIKTLEEFLLLSQEFKVST